MAAPLTAARQGNYREVGEIFDVLTLHLTKAVQVDVDQLNALRDLNSWEYYNVHTAFEVLRTPEAVYFGMRREDGEVRRAWCYVGLPASLRTSTGAAAMPRGAGEVFLAFVDESGVLYHWGLEKCDGAASDRPMGYLNRFGEEKWRKN